MKKISGNTSNDQNKASPMAAFELERHLAILTTNDSARMALISSGCYLSCEQLQRREVRDAFWITLIERLFIDETLHIYLNMDGYVTTDDEGSSINVNASYRVLDPVYDLKKIFSAGRLFSTAI